DLDVRIVVLHRIRLRYDQLVHTDFTRQPSSEFDLVDIVFESEELPNQPWLEAGLSPACTYDRAKVFDDQTEVAITAVAAVGGGACTVDCGYECVQSGGYESVRVEFHRKTCRSCCVQKVTPGERHE